MVEEEEQQRRYAEEMGDAIKYLENKTLDLKREMDVLSSLDELKSLKQEGKLKEEDEALVKSIFHVSSTQLIRRIDDDELADLTPSQVNSK
ncbi:coiled-coil domain-containing protein 94, partial [Tanacetum coccineum]